MYIRYVFIIASLLHFILDRIDAILEEQAAQRVLLTDVSLTLNAIRDENRDLRRIVETLQSFIQGGRRIADVAVIADSDESGNGEADGDKPKHLWYLWRHPISSDLVWFIFSLLHLTF